MGSGTKHHAMSAVAGIALFVVSLYWVIILVPARPIDRLIDQYGMFIFLAVLIGATIASAVAAIRISRWWVIASLAGLAAVVKSTFTIVSLWRTS